MHGYIIETEQFCAHLMCIIGFDSSTVVAVARTVHSPRALTFPHTQISSTRADFFPQPYIQYFGRLEASQNNIAHLDMKNSVFIEDIFVE